MSLSPSAVSVKFIYCNVLNTFLVYTYTTLRNIFPFELSEMEVSAIICEAHIMENLNHLLKAQYWYSYYYQTLKMCKPSSSWIIYIMLYATQYFLHWNMNNKWLKWYVNVCWVNSDLSHNQISNLPPASFQNQSYLQDLLLQGNTITVIHNTTFLGLHRLQVL